MRKKNVIWGYDEIEVLVQQYLDNKDAGLKSIPSVNKAQLSLKEDRRRAITTMAMMPQRWHNRLYEVREELALQTVGKSVSTPEVKSVPEVVVPNAMDLLGVAQSNLNEDFMNALADKLIERLLKRFDIGLSVAKLVETKVQDKVETVAVPKVQHTHESRKTPQAVISTAPIPVKVKHDPMPKQCASVKRRKIVIVGMLDKQVQQLAGDYPTLVLRAVEKNMATKQMTDAIRSADAVLGMTKFMSHNLEGVIRGAQKFSVYTRIDGGMGKFREALNQIVHGKN